MKLVALRPVKNWLLDAKPSHLPNYLPPSTKSLDGVIKGFMKIPT
jgi:hypothetical protein